MEKMGKKRVSRFMYEDIAQSLEFARAELASCERAVREEREAQVRRGVIPVLKASPAIDQMIAEDRTWFHEETMHASTIRLAAEIMAKEDGAARIAGLTLRGLIERVRLTEDMVLSAESVMASIEIDPAEAEVEEE